MAYIGNSPANVGNYQVVDDISSTFNGVLTSFALTAASQTINPAKSGQLLVSINGVLQEPDDTGAEGFKVSGSNIVFSSAPATGSTFWAVWQGQAVDIGTPSDSTVGTAQLSATGTKSGTTYLAGDNTWKTVDTDPTMGGDLSGTASNAQLGANVVGNTEVADNALSGDKIDGGTISNFTSTGIDDNATSTAITIDASEKVGIGTSILNSNKAVIEGGVAGTHSSTLALKTGSGANSKVADLAFYGTFVTPTEDQGQRRTADITSGFSTANWGTEYLAFGVGGASDAANVASEKMRIDSAGRVTTPNQPAFMAYHDGGDINYTSTINIDNVLFNDGNCYNATNSTFTAPIAGRYLFTIQMNGNYNASYGGIPRAYWQINNANIGNSIHLRGPDATDQGLEQRSYTVLLKLSANDAVRIYIQENQWDLFGANSFSGYLIG